MSLRVPFAKWHGAGNDYLFVELVRLDEVSAARVRESAPELARRWSARRTGVGADGLVLLERDPAVDLRLVMHNADGSRGRVCGTALRCVASGLHSGDFADGARRGAEQLSLASDAGEHRARIVERPDRTPAIEVALGAPTFAADAIPLRPECVRVLAGGGTGPWQVALEAGGETWEGLALSMGNPHLVLPLVHAPDGLDVAALGPPLEAHPAFPERVNVSFVRLREDGTLEQRTFERGSGETASCGSGAAAAVVALSHLAGLERDVERPVRMPGGELTVRYGADGVVWLGGPTERVCEGVLELG